VTSSAEVGKGLRSRSLRAYALLHSVLHRLLHSRFRLRPIGKTEFTHQRFDIAKLRQVNTVSLHDR
jgi:hypothetical protein